ncbi:hypothetical protein [Streptosporangium lutulentum]|uniref:Uncharacterized protein n=1 Tax=Streptosporangium lutulentum TaxID=1461250 RepID=A0ABT9Q5D3_9ACTN|nr:hypothetical protein [Streptosporangium lutulentum]MDP9841640.1 hypothetical protein [Streptosporangium lutulentum]
MAVADEPEVRLHRYTPSKVRHGGLLSRAKTGCPWPGAITVPVPYHH